MMTELRIAKNALLDGLHNSPPSKPFLKRRCLSDVSIFHLLEVRDSFRSSCCLFNSSGSLDTEVCMFGVAGKYILDFFLYIVKKDTCSTAPGCVFSPI